MSKAAEDGDICGTDGCSADFALVEVNQHSDTRPDFYHDLVIISDVICPWCFIAKRNVEEACEIVGPDLKVKVRWWPFELNPAMPKEGMERREYRLKKFGSWAHSQALDAQVAEAGRVAGLTFRHDLMARTPNTFNAHRLIWFADKEGFQDRMVEALFRAYFTEGRDVGDTAALIDLAAEVGIAKERARAFFGDTKGADEIRLEIASAQAIGVSGVPTFILDGERLFTGAQKPAIMAARLREATGALAKR